MSESYASDFYAWTREQSDALGRRSVNELDWDHLREEIDGLGSEVEHALESALEIVIHHLLKWIYQEERRTRGWALSIEEHRRRVEKRLRKTPSLKAALPETFIEAYATARLTAARETGLDLDVFPAEPSFDFDFAMNEPVPWDAPPATPVQRRSRTRKTKAWSSSGPAG